MNDIARHPDPAFPKVEDALESAGARSPAPRSGGAPVPRSSATTPIRGSGAFTRGSSRAQCRGRWTSRPGAGRRPACSFRRLRVFRAGRFLAGWFTSWTAARSWTRARRRSGGGWSGWGGSLRSRGRSTRARRFLGRVRWGSACFAGGTRTRGRGGSIRRARRSWWGRRTWCASLARTRQASCPPASCASCGR